MLTRSCQRHALRHVQQPRCGRTRRTGYGLIPMLHHTGRPERPLQLSAPCQLAPVMPVRVRSGGRASWPAPLPDVEPCEVAAPRVVREGVPHACDGAQVDRHMQHGRARWHQSRASLGVQARPW